MRTTLVLLVFALLLLALAAGCPRKNTAPAGINTPATSNQAGNEANTPPTATPPANGEAGATTPPASGEAGATTPPAAGEPGAETPPAVEEGTFPPATSTATPTGDQAKPGEEVNRGVKVTLETTKGKIVLMVHKEWAPLGAAHFLELVGAKFYDGAPWFRVLDGFVAQCGIAADPKLNEKWGEVTIKDEPVIKGNKPGFIAFGQSSMPNSRSTHIFINFADNSAALDPQGFACFAEVVEGMDVALKLAKVEFMDQNGAAPGWVAKFKAQFPNADYIVKATADL